MRTYLLERSRVVQISDEERNYHCFYQLCAGASKEVPFLTPKPQWQTLPPLHLPNSPLFPHQEKELYKLGPANSFHYLNQSSCFEIPGKENDASEYLNTKRAMSIVGVSPEEQVLSPLSQSPGFIHFHRTFPHSVSQEAIFRVVAGILHLGNVAFTFGEDNDSSKLLDETSEFHLKTVAELLK